MRATNHDHALFCSQPRQYSLFRFRMTCNIDKQDTAASCVCGNSNRLRDKTARVNFNKLRPECLPPHKGLSPGMSSALVSLLRCKCGHSHRRSRVQWFHRESMASSSRSRWVCRASPKSHRQNTLTPPQGRASQRQSQATLQRCLLQRF